MNSMKIYDVVKASISSIEPKEERKNREKGKQKAKLGLKDSVNKVFIVYITKKLKIPNSEPNEVNIKE